MLNIVRGIKSTQKKAIFHTSMLSQKNNTSQLFSQSYHIMAHILRVQAGSSRASTAPGQAIWQGSRWSSFPTSGHWEFSSEPLKRPRARHPLLSYSLIGPSTGTYCTHTPMSRKNIQFCTAIPSIATIPSTVSMQNTHYQHCAARHDNVEHR